MTARICHIARICHARICHITPVYVTSRYEHRWNGDHLLTRGRPWKSRKLLFQNPNIDHRNWAKINTSLHSSKFAVVHHVVYSLWTGWCLFKSGTLPLTLQKFIKIVYFSNFLRKMPRRAKPIPTAGENPLLMTFRTKLKYMVPTWLKKFLNGPASFWDLFSSYLAQSSYLVRNTLLRN